MGEMAQKEANRWDGMPRTHETMASMAWRRFRRHPGAIVGMIVLGAIVLASVLAFLLPYSPTASNLPERLQPPSLAHPFGTDQLGRDLLTRCLYGGRVSLTVGFLVVIITMVIGIPLGAVAGYSGGWIDNVLMRITDAALALPPLMVLILLSAILREIEAPFLEKNNVLTIALVIGILSWMSVARLVRATYLTVREFDFVTAASCVGAGNLRIMSRHILPMAMGPIIVELTLEMGYAIMEEAGLSFLGFGIMPPTPSWGNLLSNALEHMLKHPWLAFFPGLMIFLTIISINYIGDGLRDAFDPFKVLEQTGEPGRV
jgi:peptide/nickel transport system permease protein